MENLKTSTSAAILVAIFFVFCLCIPAKGKEVLLETKYGTVLGKKVTFPKAQGPIKSIDKFLGIPYAKPPLGELRFRPPVQPSTWKSKVYDATKFKDACLQYAPVARSLWPHIPLSFSEDCLYLDIYKPGSAQVPTTTDSRFKLSPVMVYIHGGGYEIGTPRVYQGDLLPLWDIVLVSVQYRLGPFGFLYTNREEARGNYGMLDQVQALKWIHENIQNFGGDPDSVTIFGESAGGSSVSLHLLSPLSKGLFHRAIAISGVDLSPFAYSKLKKARKHSEALVKHLNCSTNDEKMMECLRAANSSSFPLDTNPNIWGPVVDEVFLPDTPQALRKAGAFHKIPLLAGFTEDEGSYFLGPVTNVSGETFKGTVRWLIRSLRYVFENEPDTSDFVIESLQLHYRPWPETRHNHKFLQKIVDLLTDYLFSAPADQALAFHSQSAHAYLYEFSHLSKSHPNPAWMGITHLEDMPYYFGFPVMNLTVFQTYDDIDRNVSKTAITLFTNFAKYGNPSRAAGKGSGDVKWEAFDYTHR